MPAHTWISLYFCVHFYIVRISPLFTQTLLWVKPLHWNRRVPAVWSSLWKWKLWGECTWEGHSQFKEIFAAASPLYKVFVHCVQVRHYSSVKWVSTDEEAFFMDTAIMTAFRRLFKYITGSNANGECVLNIHVCTYAHYCTVLCSRATISDADLWFAHRWKDWDDSSCCYQNRGQQEALLAIQSLHNEFPAPIWTSGEPTPAYWWQGWLLWERWQETDSLTHIHHLLNLLCIAVSSLP